LECEETRVFVPAPEPIEGTLVCPKEIQIDRLSGVKRGDSGRTETKKYTAFRS